MQARNTGVKITINNTDVTSRIAKYIESIKYSDSIGGESDTVEIVLDDSNHKLLQNFSPKKGTPARIELIKNNWNSLQVQGKEPPLSLYLGSFELDEISYRTPPSTYTVKFNSCPHSAQIKRVANYKVYENVTLKKIAATIAAQAGLTLYFEANYDPKIERAEQSEQSDLEFLSKLCKDNALNLKIHDGKLIIFDVEKYEKRDAVTCLTYGDPIIKQFNLNTTLTDTFGSSYVSFDNSGVNDIFGGLFGDFLSSIFTIPEINRDDPNVKKIFEKVSDPAEAERLARARLREQNKNEWTINFTCSLSFGFLSGNTIFIKGFGIYDSKYLIEKADHSLTNSGSVTSFKAHRCLNW